MLILVIILFMGCWGPRLFINAIIKYGLRSYNHTAYEARFVCYLLSFVHSCLNPIVYSLMSSNVRQIIFRSLDSTCLTSSSRKMRMCNAHPNGQDDGDNQPSKTNFKDYFRRHRASSSEVICYSTRTTNLSSISTLTDYKTSVVLDTDISNYLDMSNFIRAPDHGPHRFTNHSRMSSGCAHTPFISSSSETAKLNHKLSIPSNK